MRQVDIVETNFDFRPLTPRSYDDIQYIIIHHTGSTYNVDVDAATIHQLHLDQGWSGIGYNYVIRKSGMIERGRPDEFVPSQCYGYNSISLGVHLSGNFMEEAPTDEQIESCALLLANLCVMYNLPINNETIKGHRDFNATGCPGDVLYDLLPTIIGKAVYYFYH